MSHNETTLVFIVSGMVEPVKLHLTLNETKRGTKGAVSCWVEGTIPNNQTIDKWLGNDPENFGDIVSWVAATQYRFEKKWLPSEILEFQAPVDLLIEARTFNEEADAFDEMFFSADKWEDYDNYDNY